MDAAIVPNFIVVDTDYRTLPERLVGDVRDFAGSNEYAAIDDSQRHRPEAVFSALVKLCIRLHRQQMSGRLRPRDNTTLGQIHKLFEGISQGDTVSSKYTLVTSMFDALAQDEGWEVLPNLRKRFEPSARRLFDHWIT